MSSDHLTLCCAPACPIMTACRRHETWHEGKRAWANFGASVRLSALGTFECDRQVPMSVGGPHVAINRDDA